MFNQPLVVKILVAAVAAAAIGGMWFLAKLREGSADQVIDDWHSQHRARAQAQEEDRWNP